MAWIGTIGVGSYRQYCPIARASEILADRWNPLIIRNLVFGAETFSEVARGLPTMSRSMLSKRLDEITRWGDRAWSRLGTTDRRSSGGSSHPNLERSSAWAVPAAGPEPPVTVKSLLTNPAIPRFTVCPSAAAQSVLFHEYAAVGLTALGLRGWCSVWDLRHRQSDRAFGEQEAVAVVGELDRLAGK